MKTLKSHIRDIPGFPKPGIIFKDITPLLANGLAFKDAVKRLAQPFRSSKVDVVLSVEARGFLFGAGVSLVLGAGLVPVRKKGKLPYRTYAVSYGLEYGTDTLEIHQDAFKKGARVLIVDDLLATGGTTRAVCDLIKKMGGTVVGLSFLIELTALNGRDKLSGYKVHSLIKDKYC